MVDARDTSLDEGEAFGDPSFGIVHEVTSPTHLSPCNIIISQVGNGRRFKTHDTRSELEYLLYVTFDQGWFDDFKCPRCRLNAVIIIWDNMNGRLNEACRQGTANTCLPNPKRAPEAAAGMRCNAFVSREYRNK